MNIIKCELDGYVEFHCQRLEEHPEGSDRGGWLELTHVLRCQDNGRTEHELVTGDGPLEDFGVDFEQFSTKQGALTFLQEAENDLRAKFEAELALLRECSALVAKAEQYEDVAVYDDEEDYDGDEDQNIGYEDEDEEE